MTGLTDVRRLERSYRTWTEFIASGAGVDVSWRRLLEF